MSKKILLLAHQLPVRTSAGIDFIDFTTIIHCEGNDNQTVFHLNNTRDIMMVCETLAYWEEHLLEFGFVRIHKSYVINCAHLVHYEKCKHPFVILTKGVKLPVTDTYKEKFLKAIGLSDEE